MKARTFFALLIAALLFAACNNSGTFETHPKGFEYKLVDRAQAGLSPRYKDVVTLKVRITTESDSLIKQSEFFRVQVVDPKYKGGINDALQFMYEGDSMIFRLNAIDYYKYEEKKPAPTFVQNNDKLLFYIRLVDVKSIEEIEKERQDIEISGKYQEKVSLKIFLKQIGIKDNFSMDKVFVKHKNAGKGGRPNDDSKVAIHYFGYFVDGKPFDNSYERNEPFEFSMKGTDVIPGLIEGVKQMEKGGKATIVIPSKLAYGSEGLPQAGIAPFTTLIFDVELVSVKK